MFGHCADSHTVCRFSPRANFLRLWKFSPIGARALSHAGLAVRGLVPSSIWINSEVAMNPLFYDAFTASGDSEPHLPPQGGASNSKGMQVRQQVLHLLLRQCIPKAWHLRLAHFHHVDHALVCGLDAAGKLLLFEY